MWRAWSVNSAMIVQPARSLGLTLGATDEGDEVTKSPLPDRYDLELRYPGDYDAAIWTELERLAQRIADGFEVANGILHIEFLVARDTRTVYLIEFAVRGCGSKVATHLMPALTGVDVVRVVMRQALGLPVQIEPSRARHGALQFLMFPRGRIA